MSTPTEVIQQAYAAFGRRDIPAILEMLTDDIDWRFQASAASP
jgi:ketosteroid isomerase-like protein